MSLHRAVLAIAVATLGAGSAVAAGPAARCLTQEDAQAVTLVALPAIVRDAGRVCVALPATSLLRREKSPFLTKYDAAANAAWPAARRALAALSDPATELLLMNDYARPLLTSLIAPQITGRLQASDCPTLDRLVTLVEPLPPTNTAGIVVATLQYIKAEHDKGKVTGVPDLPICTGASR